ncbi:MAG: PASTA domain-containing protein [Nitrospirota bacterium]
MQKDIRNLIRIPLYIFGFIVLGLVFGYLTFKVLSFSRTVEVPDLRGKTLIEANKLVTEKGLYLKIEGEEYDAEVPQGNILRQNIPAGNKVKERRGIKVVTSRGPKVWSVPLLVNETLDNAETLLLQKGLRISKVIMAHSDLVDKDRIIAQKPGPEEQLSETITVVASLGPYERVYYCPDFKGMAYDQAKGLAEKLNLRMLAEGSGQVVQAQKPEPGRRVKAGDTIYLQVF